MNTNLWPASVHTIDAADSVNGPEMVNGVNGMAPAGSVEDEHRQACRAHTQEAAGYVRSGLEGPRATKDDANEKVAYTHSMAD